MGALNEMLAALLYSSRTLGTNKLLVRPGALSHNITWSNIGTSDAGRIST